MSLIAGRGCRWPPRRDSVSPCAPLSGGRDTHDGHENSPILVFFSNLLDPLRDEALVVIAEGWEEQGSAERAVQWYERYLETLDPIEGERRRSLESYVDALRRQ